MKDEGILGPVDLVLGTSTSCLYLNLPHQSLPQFSQRPGTPNHFVALHLQGLDFIKCIHLYDPLWLLPCPPEVLTSPPTDRVCHMPLEMHSSLPLGGTLFKKHIFLRKHLFKKNLNYCLWWFYEDTTQGRDPQWVSLTHTTEKGTYLGIWPGFTRRVTFFNWRGRLLKKEKEEGRKLMRHPFPHR